MALPTITMSITSTIWGLPTTGRLIYKYSAFQNLQNLDITQTTDVGLSDLILTTQEANVNIEKPIELNVEKSYDNSVNLIVNDKVNPIKLVNSRFYLLNSSEYAIGDRRGNLDTNIYTKENFSIESGLIKTVRKIVGLDFEGVEDGGVMPAGNYNFYFKLADVDGNESDFVSESGQVVCYIGAVNKPTSIRGGQLNENSSKLVKFKLKNLDLAYDYIIVYYTRNSGDSLVESNTAYRINNKFKILGSSTKISITGYEETEEISLSDINLRYAYFDSAKTAASCQNMLFVGNTTNNYDLFTTLEKYSLFITPTVSTDESIGNITDRYQDLGKNSNEYYNPNNIYYRLSYWDEEIYRLGIVYVLNNFTLSPVFNIRGKKEISSTNNTTFEQFASLNSVINYDDNYIIEGTDENVKGVFKINSDDLMFDGKKDIKPIGIKLNFDAKLFDKNNLSIPSIDTLTKGFFIVRQKRIPTILSQGISINTTKEGHIPTIKASTSVGAVNLLESYLQNVGGIPLLGRSIYGVNDDKVNCNALLCPEANLRSSIFASLFNSSSFKLKSFKYKPALSKFIKVDGYDKLFAAGDLSEDTGNSVEIDTELLLVNSNTVLINNKEALFSSVAGNELEAWSHVDPIYGNIEDIDPENPVTSEQLSLFTQKTRGIFNSYLGSSRSLITPNTYYNIYNKDYDWLKWKDYFKVRHNDSSPFYPISDRITWSDLSNNSLSCYRGDCYINTYTHRMLWNFIDPELPTNNRIVDKYTWFKNYKVKKIKVKTSSSADFVVQDNSDAYEAGTSYEYKKVLPIFTFKIGDLVDSIDNGVALSTATVLTPEAKKYQKYADSNGEFGYSKLNRPDVNAVGLGHWVTFKICSNINLGLRDEDFSNPAEETLHKRKRSFYPYSSADQLNKLPESTIINKGISKSLGERAYFEIPDVPFIRTHFNSRINYSNLAIESMFQDGSRIFNSDAYQDYTMEYGELVKLVEWYGTLIAVMEHGVLMIPVNERAMMTNASGENVYINTENVLPQNPKVLSNTFGSIWPEAVIKSSRFVYGIDTIGKKIWRTNGEAFELISDMRIQKFLNDNINLKVTDRDESINYNLIKIHYNAFKNDVIFTYKYGNEKWSLCWNELTEKWVTRYTWFPEFSENINNIFYTFANQSSHSASFGKLFKHGFAGPLDQKSNIKPTIWYEEQHPFEFEFVVIGVQGVQKIFDNLKIISNKTEPNSLTCEIVGEGYDWYKYKEVISWMENNPAFNVGEASEDLSFIMTEDGFYSIEHLTLDQYETGYAYLLQHTMAEIEADYPNFPRPYGMLDNERFIKLPYIPKIKNQSVLDEITWNTLNYSTVLINDLWNSEDRVLSYQEGKSIRKVGRLKGNMDYIEDSWDIQIQPVRFRYAFLRNNVLTYSKIAEMKVRDKYIKIRIKYDGTKLAIVNAIKTLFTISYA